MKTSTSFAILAILAAAPSVLAAPLPAQSHSHSHSSEGLGATVTLYTGHSSVTYASVELKPTAKESPNVLAQTGDPRSHTSAKAKATSHPSHVHPSASASASAVSSATSAKNQQHHGNAARDLHDSIAHLGDYLKNMHLLKGSHAKHDETDVHVHGRDVLGTVTNDVAPVESTVTKGSTGNAVLPLPSSTLGPVKASQLGSGAVLDPATSGGKITPLIQSTETTVLEAGTSMVGTVISTESSGIAKTVSGAGVLGNGNSGTLNPDSETTAIQNDEKNVGGVTSIVPDNSLPISTSHGLNGSFKTGQTGNTLQPISNSNTVQSIDKQPGNVKLPVALPVDGSGNAGQGITNLTNQKTAVDPISAQTLPSGNENQNSLISISQKNVNAKVLQTPGKANTLIDQDTGTFTNGTNLSDTHGGQVNTSSTDTWVTVNEPLKSSGDGIVFSKGGKIGPEDHKGNVVNQAKENDHNFLGNTTITGISTNTVILKTTAIPNHVDLTHTSVRPTSTSSSSSSAQASPKPTSFAHDQALIADNDKKVTSASHSSSSVTHTHTSTTTPIISIARVTLAPSITGTGTVGKVVASVTKQVGTSILKPVQSGTVTLGIDSIHVSKIDVGNPTTTTSVTKVLQQLPKQAQTIYDQRSSTVVPCDGLLHSSSDLVDQCISSSLISTKPLGTEVCPDELQKDIKYVAPDSLDNDMVQSVSKYVRLCVESAK